MSASPVMYKGLAKHSKSLDALARLPVSSNQKQLLGIHSRSHQISY